jgi:hypothetical protein
MGINLDESLVEFSHNLCQVAKYRYGENTSVALMDAISTILGDEFKLELIKQSLSAKPIVGTIVRLGVIGEIDRSQGVSTIKLIRSYSSDLSIQQSMRVYDELLAGNTVLLTIKPFDAITGDNAVSMVEIMNNFKKKNIGVSFE